MIVKSLAAFVFRADPGLGIGREVQARNVAGIGLIPSGRKEPQFVFCDGPAKASVHVVQSLEASRIRESECLEPACQIVALEAAGGTVQKKSAVEVVTAGARNEIALHADARRVSRVPGNLDVDLLEQQRRQRLIGPAAIAHHVSDFQSVDHLNFITCRASVCAELRLNRRSRRAADVYNSSAAAHCDSHHCRR